MRPPRRVPTRVSALPIARVALVLLALGAGSVLVGCSSGGDRAGAPAPTSASRSPGLDPSAQDDLAAFAQDCSQKVESRSGQLDYPATLTIRLDESTTYGAAIDVRGAPAPAERVISTESATTEEVVVQCQVDARLVAVGDGLDVVGGDESNGGWRSQRFSESGVVEWSWTVEAVDLPSSQQLRLEVRPAVRAQGGELLSSASTVALTTTVEVQSTALQRVGRWVETQWPTVLTVAGVLGGAALGLLAWVTHMRRAVQEATARRTSKAGSGTTSDPGTGMPAAAQSGSGAEAKERPPDLPAEGDRGAGP